MSEITNEQGQKIVLEIEHKFINPFSFGNQRCEIAVIKMPRYSVLRESINMRTEDNTQRLDNIVMKSSSILGTDLSVLPDMYEFMTMYDVARLQGAANYFLAVYGDQLEWVENLRSNQLKNSASPSGSLLGGTQGS